MLDSVPATVFDRMLHHARREFPRECCGMVLRRGEQWRVAMGRNVQDALHEFHWQRYPRDGTTAYTMDPWTLVTVMVRRLFGWQIYAIYHSHPRRARAIFSVEDRLGAMGRRGVRYPAALQVVVALPAADSPDWEARAYRFDQEWGGFKPLALSWRDQHGALHQHPDAMPLVLS